MELKIISEEENKLFNRKEVRFEVSHDKEATPKLADVRRAIATKTGGNVSHVIIDGFKTLFGIGRTIGDARIYDKMDELKDYEPTYLLKRNKIIQEEPKKEKEEESKEEKEVKEEKKEEEKEVEEKKEESPKEDKGEADGKQG
jgi:small subunit ribosomal protein S24e